ncbi:PLC-like phosphodiesterase [Rhexocercosporidium sp. MPI-PUGE-AT-0058]|nr:PLC-like phosphodiesterase [Rhexocercosporidium sp. MPI-PUGE-AT-0058]
MLPNILALSFLLSSAVAATCNGHSELCSRKYSNVTQIGAHDSAFVGILPTDNQFLSVTSQLDGGIRYLQAQSHLKDGILQLCHTSCDLKDAGPLVEYLNTIKTWMDKNPNEVVSVLLTNGDGAPVSQFGTDMTTSGLISYAFSPGKQLALEDWPTLQGLIDAKTRLVMFLDFGADTAIVPYILDEFSYYFETAFDVTDNDFPSCDLDRPRESDGSGLMYIVNHFLDLDIFGILIPATIELPRTNAATGDGSVGAQADLCTSKWGRRPNVVLVDFFETGDVFKAQDTLNGL